MNYALPKRATPFLLRFESSTTEVMVKRARLLSGNQFHFGICEALHEVKVFEAASGIDSTSPRSKWTTTGAA